MNKVLVKNNEYYIVKTSDNKFLVRENTNKSLGELPQWHYYLSSNPSKAIKCEDSYIAGVMLDDYISQIKDEIAEKYGSFVSIDRSAFAIAQMVVSYQIGES